MPGSARSFCGSTISPLATSTGSVLQVRLFMSRLLRRTWDGLIEAGLTPLSAEPIPPMPLSAAAPPPTRPTTPSTMSSAFHSPVSAIVARLIPNDAAPATMLPIVSAMPMPWRPGTSMARTPSTALMMPKAVLSAFLILSHRL